MKFKRAWRSSAKDGNPLVHTLDLIKKYIQLSNPFYQGTIKQADNYDTIRLFDFVKNQPQ